MFDRNHTFKVRENEYTISVPNNRSLIAIEVMKSQLSTGVYGSLLRSSTISSTYVLDTIDCIAYLTILCPQLTKDLKVETLLDLDVVDMKELVDLYKENIVKWIGSWQQILTGKIS